MTETPPDLSRLRIERTRPAPRGGRLWKLIAVALLLVVAYQLWQPFATSVEGLEVRTARVLRVGGAADQSGVSANGYVVPRNRAALSTDVQGRLVEISVEEGDRVTAGQVVARLDTTQLEASHARALADLDGAKASAELARLAQKRMQKLHTQGHAGTAELDTANAELKSARARVQALDASAREIAILIDKSSVRAPFDGTIVEKNAEVGEVVSAISASGPSARGAVATLVDFSSLEVQVELAQTSLAAAREGAPVLVYLDAYPEDAYRGRVRQIWPTANRQNATVELRAEILDKDERVLPEMGVRVLFVPGDQAEPKPPRVLLPRAALVQGSPPSAWVVRDGTVSRRELELTGEEENGLLEVRSGLSGNELVVVSPPPGLEEGGAVRRREDQP